MTNSLIVLLTSIGFLAFGYLTLIRIAYKQYFKTVTIGDDTIRSHFAEIRRGLGQSALFISLPATSLLLYWGWAIALIWIIVFHLLVESFINLQLSTQLDNDAADSKLTYTPTSQQEKVINIVWHCYYVLLLAITISLLSSMIDKQSGLLFMLLALIPIHAIMDSKNQKITGVIKVFLAILFLALGLLFADQLGISIYGEINLFSSSDRSQLGKLNWLVLNNTTLIALSLIIAAYFLSEKPSFNQVLAKSLGWLLALFTIYILLKILWLRPIVDAPLSSAQNRAENLPNFATLCLFLFVGMSSILLKPKPLKSDSQIDLANVKFTKLQSNSLFQLILTMTVIICLACALGIGAWSTHYLNWADSDFSTHFNLIITSLLELADSGSKLGFVSYTLFMSGLAAVGLSLLIQLFSQLKSQQVNVSKQSSHSNSLLIEMFKSRVFHCIVIFISACWLIKFGVSINLWLLVGIFAWLIVCNWLLQNVIKSNSNEIRDLIQSGFVAVLLCLGYIQIFSTLYSWLATNQYFYAAASSCLFFASVFLWYKSIPLLVQNLRRLDKSTTDRSILD